MYKSFKEMPVWQNAIEAAVVIHGLTDNLPKKEDYGFTSQIRRSALRFISALALENTSSRKAAKTAREKKKKFTYFSFCAPSDLAW